MKWKSIESHIPPMGINCFIFTENNYFYVARLIDSDNPDVWVVDTECDECGSGIDKIYGVTHFCIPEAVRIEK